MHNSTDFGLVVLLYGNNSLDIIIIVVQNISWSLSQKQDSSFYAESRDD